MQRWIASAAGGTSQRLNPARATMASRDSGPGAAPGRGSDSASSASIRSSPLLRAGSLPGL